MVFKQLEGKPLRVYIESDAESIQRLSALLYQRFYPDYNPEPKNAEDPEDESVEVDNLIFLDEEKNQFYFPAGLVPIMKDNAERLGFEVTVEMLEEVLVEESKLNISPYLVDGIELRDYQLDAVKYSLLYKRGIIQSPTGSGKSSMMIGVCKYLLESQEGNMIMCVPTTYLLHQTYENAIKGGLSEDVLGRYGDGYQIDPSKRIIIATVQTLSRRLLSGDAQLLEWVKDIKCVIYDECQHIGSKSWHSVADKLQPEYLLGFSAEPFYNDKDNVMRDLLLRGTVGPILYRVSIKDLIDRGYLSKPYVIALETSYPGGIYTLINWQVVNKLGIVNNPNRNALICETASMLIELNKNPLILVQQIAHGNELGKTISMNGRKVAVMTGGMTTTMYMDGREVDVFRDEEGLTKKQFQEGLIDALIGTSTMDEGVDMPSLSSVILAGGGKSKLKLVQRVGRGLRPKKGDNTTFIIDFQDKFNLVTHKQFKSRKDTFTNNHIPVYFSKGVYDAKKLIMQLRDERNHQEGQ